MRIVDLRSDTITMPTEQMRSAMASAPVGDDVFGEDPTVNRLEEMAAERMGKEAALYVTSGTMANIVSQMTHCNTRGCEMILGDQSHILFYEQGGSAAIGGIHPRTIPNQPDGTLALEDIENVIRPDNIHFPRTRLIVLENTHNRCNGRPLSVEYMEKVAALAGRYGIRIHVDGARIFNAAIGLGVKPSELVVHADSVSFCLSKGLSAPIGSLVCGSQDFISEARRNRKVLGGGMRQAGIPAAAGIVAITEMVDRLAEDHENAQMLARGLAEIPGLSIDPADVRTNLVFFDVTGKDLTTQTLCEKLNEKGVRVLPLGPSRIRAVTHHPISGDDIQYVLKVFREIF